MVSPGSNRGGLSRVSTRGGVAGPGSPRASPAATAFAALRRRWRWAPPGSSTLERAARAFLLASAALVLSCALYLYVLRYVGRGGRAFAAAGFVGDAVLGLGGEPCDVFDGAWVPDDTGLRPLYNSSGCPFAERGFDCLANGRNDTGYLKWRWKPRRCGVPRFAARTALERLRGKRVVFVGDSMSRSQWESFICMLMAGVDDPRTVFEVNGNEITKTIRHLAVRFASHGLTVEFFRSVFLVQEHPAPRHAPKRVKSTLRLDRMDNFSRKWVNSDVLIFNTGHWWTPTKLFDTGCYFQAGRSLKLGTSIDAGFRMALETWASWVQKRVDLNRTHVFFRTYEPSHWGLAKHGGLNFLAAQSTRTYCIVIFDITRYTRELTYVRDKAAAAARWFTGLLHSFLLFDF
ncbi:Protein trichome berefringence-like 7 [Zea mays]|uniref:Protein trichome berefringence-like 7 n=1 Tax=Zea mays TaxID=4577 RepID=A0A1D6M4N0_MAIZE|nr:Protein trichome berefringence-like 7 [Zea mays]